MQKMTVLTLLVGCTIVAGARYASAHSGPDFVQNVALDECDPGR